MLCSDLRNRRSLTRSAKRGYEFTASLPQPVNLAHVPDNLYNQVPFQSTSTTYGVWCSILPTRAGIG